MDTQKLRYAVDAAMPLGIELLETLRQQTADSAGVSRESYGAGEQFAHDLLQKTAQELGLESRVDFAGNLYMTLPGKDRSAPGWITGSHLDSVPMGGNYDGAAGVIAGVVALAALRRSSEQPPRDITMPSGAGHDAQDFAHAEYPAAMIFVRNAHGSHNPAEALDMNDFALGTQLLARCLSTGA